MSGEKRYFDKEAASWDQEQGSSQKFDSSEKMQTEKTTKLVCCS